MKLQLALDRVTPEDAINIIGRVKKSVDIIEIGTIFIVRFGLIAIREIQKKYPDIVLLVDTKIVDGGKIETFYASLYGADYITVLASAEDITIRNVLDEAKKHGIKTVVDMIGVENPAKRASEIDEMGPDYICAHTAVDVQKLGGSPFNDYRSIRGVLKHSGTAIAGGIKLENLKELKDEPPDILIIGGGIMSSDDIGAAAQAFRKEIDKMNKWKK